MSKAAELAKIGEVATNSQIGGRRNIVINGAMQVAQRATSATGVGASNGYFTVDRMYMLASTAGRLTMTQTADGPSGFANCIKLDCTTADTSVAAGEYFVLAYHMEGQDLQQLKKGTSDAETVTVSFYVKGNASATYTCEFRDVENTRYSSQEFSVTTSWNRVSLTFDGDTVGALSDDTTGRMYLYFWLHAGSTYAGGTHTSNAWHTTDANRMSDSQTSIVDSTDRTFFITGLQFEVGSVATPFEHRSFGEELALAQRYYTVVAHGAASQDGTSHPISMGSQYGTDTLYSNLELPCDMRTTPTLEIVSATNYYTFFRNGGGDTVDDFTLTKWGTRVIEFYNNSDVSGTAGHSGFIRTANSAAKFALTAEL